VDVESDMGQHNRVEDPECPEQRDVSVAPKVPVLIWPTRKFKRQAEKVLLTVNAIERLRNKGVKKMLDRINYCLTSIFMYLDRAYWLNT
jgi:hypothetical protein